MRAMPRLFRRPRIPVTGTPAGPESRHPPDLAGTHGIARMARSYEGRRSARATPARSQRRCNPVRCNPV